MALSPNPRKGLLLTLALAGCGEKETSTDTDLDVSEAIPAPWLDAETTPLSRARVLLSPSISDADTPTALAVLPDRALSFVLDSAADRVHVLDSRYGHDGRAYCIDTAHVADSSAKGSRPECPEETTEVQRGALVPGDRPIAMAIDPVDRSAAVLTRGGLLFHADADVLRAHPLDFLALDSGSPVPGLTPPVESAQLAAHAGRIAIATGDTLILIEDTEIHSHTLPGQIADLALDSESAWAATDGGVWSETDVHDAVGTHLVQWQNTWWLVQPEESHLLSLQTDAHTSVDDVTGPAATDPRTDVLHLVTSAGFTRLDPDGGRTSIPTRSIIDLDINLSGETVLLHPDGEISVLVDETAYAPTHPLNVFITAFSERPRNTEDAVPCTSDDGSPSIRSFMNTAHANRAMLSDLPAPVGMGITPALADQAARCSEDARLDALMDHPLTSPGILIHQEPSACTGDLACHTDALREMAAGVTGALTPTWISGMSTHHELDVNWVASIHAAGLPSRYLFYGMSLHPDIGHHTDLRAKDPWPVTLGDMGRAWGTSSAAAIAKRKSTGTLSVYPGDDIPAFNLGGCANLFLLECHPLLRGGGVTIDSADTAILDLLLHRAISEQVPAPVRTWSFHLPDIGTYDFTEGCTSTDRVWSGEDCAGARLQEWLIDVDRRLVAAGLVQWTPPGTLEQP